MIEDKLQCFANNIFVCLMGEHKVSNRLVIKKHIDNLTTHGEFSFPISVKSWHEFSLCRNVVDKVNSTIFEIIGKDAMYLVDESKEWELLIHKVKLQKDRLYLFLERPRAIRVGFEEALKINAVSTQRIVEKCARVVLDPLIEENLDITSLRAKYMCSVINNICAVRKLDKDVFVTSKSTSNREGCDIVLSATVLNSKTGKIETVITAEDFIRIRQDEMTLIAQHKYGVRVSTDSKWKKFIAHLGESAVAFELLQAKLSSPVKINFDNCAVGSSKGASFILYNCARLETIIKTYNDNVTQGTYPELGKFDDIDFSLLTQEEEWSLIFNYILGLPSLLNSCVYVKGKSCEFRPHNICNFLCSMVREFSQYYRKTRILTAHLYISIIEIRSFIKPTIDCLLNQRLPSGNFVCSVMEHLVLYPCVPFNGQVTQH